MEGRLYLEFMFDDMMRIKTWHFSIRQHRELIPRSILAMHVSSILWIGRWLALLEAVLSGPPWTLRNFLLFAFFMMLLLVTKILGPVSVTETKKRMWNYSFLNH